MAADGPGWPPISRGGMLVPHPVQPLESHTVTHRPIKGLGRGCRDFGRLNGLKRAKPKP